MFSNAVLNIFKNPKNAGRISKPDGIADCFNEDNTAHVEFSLRIEQGIITKCQFRAQANPYYIAICSTITNMVKGKMVSMVFLDPYSVKKELGDESEYNIDFCINCLKLAIDDYKEKLEKENKQKGIIKNEPVINESPEELEEETKEEQISEESEVILTEEIDDDNILDDEDFFGFDFFDEGE